MDGRSRTAASEARGISAVARASQEELRRDYEDFLRQRAWPQWPPDHPALKRFRTRRCATLEESRVWQCVT